jgi:uroporphyrinogen decarboxylase
MILDTACRLKEEFPNAEIRVPLSGPFSLASGLLGFDTLLCEVMTDPEASLKSFFHLTDGQLAVCEAVARAGLRVTLFESGAAPPLLSPGLFRDLVLPPVKRLVESGAEMFDDPPAFIIGGNTVPILDAILATGTRDLICPAETDQAAFMEKIAARPDVTVRINIDPGLFATGSWERVAPELERAASMARLKPGTQIGSGVLPYETDTHIVLKARDFVASL